MIDIKFLRENPDIVKQNIKNKFQDNKLPLVDEAIKLDSETRQIKGEVENLRSIRNKASQEIGKLMREGKKTEADVCKKEVSEINDKIASLDEALVKVEADLKKIMMVIPNIIDKSVPIGPNDTYNVERKRFLEPTNYDFEVPYHLDIIEKLGGIDLDSARRVAGNGFYYLMGNIARLHSAVLAYARDFMINKGFTYVVPPFMIRSNVVDGVMSFNEMDQMMYKIEGEDLYLIGTSEHSMIGKFIGQILDKSKLPYTYTSYSPCFRKEKGAHGIEEVLVLEKKKGLMELKKEEYIVSINLKNKK